MDKRLCLCVAVLMSISVLPPARAAKETAEQSPTAAELVQAVRQGENWIHDVNSFYIRIESTWTSPPEVVAARRARLQDQYPEETLDPNKWPELQLQSRHRLEIAFDRQRIRYVLDEPGASLMVRVWNGKQAISHEKYERHSQEHYYLANKPERIFRGLFYDLSWLRAQPHSFWWQPIDVDEAFKSYGRAEDFKLVGREEHGGAACYVLEYHAGGEAQGLGFRWYVGATDRRIRTLDTLVDGRITSQYRLEDYRQVAPGCWFPMSQSYALSDPDSSGAGRGQSQRDLKITEIRINERLPDDLFREEIKPGVKVSEEWFGETRTYTRVPSLRGKPLPSFDGIELDGGPAALNDKPLLLCFWDPHQRPSRHCMRRLAEQAGQLGKRGIVLVAIQSAKTGSQASDPWTKETSDSCRSATIEGDSSEIQFTWGVRSLPWLILADARHIVQAEGFGLDELEARVKQLLGE